MLPVLSDGELCFIRTDPLALRRLRRGDIVVLRHPWEPSLKLIKRIVAVPGDAFDLEGLVDGAREPGHASILAASEYFVGSDNPAGLDDSRRFGPVHRRLIEGRLWRRGTVAPSDEVARQR